MKLRIFLYILCVSMLYADVNVSGIELNRTSDKLEVLINIDGAYDKSPQLTGQDGYKGVIFPSLHAKSHNENFSSFFLSEIQVFNIQENLYVLGIGDTSSIDVSVSKAIRKLKITFSKVAPSKSEIDVLLQTPYQTQIPTIDIAKQPLSRDDNLIDKIPFKNDMGIDTWRYIAVLGVMAFLVFVLWIVKRYIVHKKQFGGYFATIPKRFDPTKIDVISQKNLDSKHRILTIESNGYRYLILIGATSTTLIDRYPIPQSITPEEQIQLDNQFANLLEQKQERLSKYLRNDRE